MAYKTNTEVLLDAIRQNTASTTLTAESLALDVSVDGLEGLQGTTNTKLDTIEASADALIAANHTDLVALESSQDKFKTITITPTLTGTQYTGNNKVFFATTAIAGAVRRAGTSALLRSIQVINKNTELLDLQFLFFSANTSVGTEYQYNYGGGRFFSLTKVGTLPFEPVMLHADSGTTCYIAGVLSSLGSTDSTTPSMSLGDITIRLGIEY